MRSIIIFIIPLIVCSCINEIEVTEPADECRKLSVGEARAFFEDRFTRLYMAQANFGVDDENQSVLFTGDFTPQW